MLTRELWKASQLIHPNIVLFMGAVIDTGVVLVSESMVTNLRYELEKKAFAKQEVINIATDIAKALSFLHSARPRPIIHRAVYTHTVSLEPMAFKWRAKLCDTILSNYYHNMAEGPMTTTDIAPYCPPEMPDPKLHSVKLDIYSYGVVVLEVLTRKPPPSTETERDKLLQTLKWPLLVGLLSECVTEEQVIRPTADRILTALDSAHTKHTK